MSQCIDHMSLRRYASGESNVKERAAIESHLSLCSLCSDALEGFAFIQDDNIINNLKAEVKSRFGEEKEERKIIPFFGISPLKAAAVLLILIGLSSALYIGLMDQKDGRIVTDQIDSVPIQPEMLQEKPLPVYSDQDEPEPDENTVTVNSPQEQTNDASIEPVHSPAPAAMKSPSSQITNEYHQSEESEMAKDISAKGAEITDNIAVQAPAQAEDAPAFSTMTGNTTSSKMEKTAERKKQEKAASRRNELARTKSLSAPSAVQELEQDEIISTDAEMQTGAIVNDTVRNITMEKSIAVLDSLIASPDLQVSLCAKYQKGLILQKEGKQIEGEKLLLEAAKKESPCRKMAEAALKH